MNRKSRSRPASFADAGGRCRPFRLEALEDCPLLSVVHIGVEIRVNTYTSDRQPLARTAMDADGDFVVAEGSEGQGEHVGSTEDAEILDAIPVRSSRSRAASAFV